MITIFAYLLLYAAVFSLWLPLRLPLPLRFPLPLWGLLTGAACLTGLLTRQLEVLAVLPVLVLFYALYLHRGLNSPVRPPEKAAISTRSRQIIVLSTILLLSFTLGAHTFTDFHNLLVVSDMVLSPNAVPFTMYLNFDKALVGLLLLGLTHRLVASLTAWKAIFRQTLPFAVVFSLLVLLAAVLLHKVVFEPKLPAFLPLWSVNNLLFVCTAEEAFFRGFIQKNLTSAFQHHPQGARGALLVASLLFGFAHYAGGIAFSIWGTLAGLGYGWIYQKTGYIEAAIITHFLLNLLHIVFFTYPALSG